jgi:outer membrane protein assembly factor BamB
MRRIRFTTAVLILVLLVCVGLTGCGGSSGSPSTSTARNTTAAKPPPQEEPEEPVAEAAPEPEPERLPPGAPEPGSTLTYFEGSGRVNLISDGEGFSIVDSLTDLGTETDESTITTYDVAGRQLTVIPSGTFAGECGAADLKVPGLGRVIITEVEPYIETAGIEQTEYPTVLKAWNAHTGELLWSVPIRPEGDEESEAEGNCGAYDGHLQGFSATDDGRWGLYGSTYSARVIDLVTGQVETRVRAEGVLGNYPIVAADEEQGIYQAIDPETGEVLGSHQLNVDFYQQQEQLSMAARGALYSDGSGSSPAAISTDGDRLIVVEESGEEEVARTIAYSLPSFEVAWTRPANQEDFLAGEGGNLVFEVAREGGEEGELKLVALNDQTGEPVWSVPDGEVCGVTESQLLLSVNGQRATIDLATGEQVSYEEEAECPSVLPGGIGLSSEGGEILEGTELTVLQLLEP